MNREERQQGRQERKDQRRGKALDNAPREVRSNREEEDRSRRKRSQGRSPWVGGGLWGGRGQWSSWPYPAAPASCWTGSGRRCGSFSQPLAGRSPGTSPEGLRKGEREGQAGEKREASQQQSGIRAGGSHTTVKTPRERLVQERQAET